MYDVSLKTTTFAHIINTWILQINMKIYYYHTRPIKPALQEWEQYRHPGHILYGLPLLKKNGIDCILHRYKAINGRLKLALYTAKEILCCKEHYDAIYGTSFRGLELIIFLRALGLYRKPIAIWHHTAVRRSSNKLREAVSRFFYTGIDKMYFFSQKLIKDSLLSLKASPLKMELIHWGPDLAFYDHLLAEIPDRKTLGFVSTGKENRDVSTLLQAFVATEEEFDLYISPQCGHINYKEIIESFSLSESVHIHYTGGIIPYELAKMVACKSCIVICCLDFPYTVGLTTLVEAFALGLPVICSRNPNFEVDIDKEGIGITVEYGDVQGWINAIRYMADHPEEARKMGANARKLAEERFNLEIFSREIAESLSEISNISSKKRTFA